MSAVGIIVTGRLSMRTACVARRCEQRFPRPGRDTCLSFDTQGIFNQLTTCGCAESPYLAEPIWAAGASLRTTDCGARSEWSEMKERGRIGKARHGLGAGEGVEG